MKTVGWECPVCHSVWSPEVKKCPKCSPVEQNEEKKEQQLELLLEVEVK